MGRIVLARDRRLGRFIEIKETSPAAQRPRRDWSAR
jgi:hypothetical protein